jgi:7-keto-8-aminopelargonate synthetase-like enzyme
MTERNVAVAASTTLLHRAAIPALVGDNDLVIIDQFAHASLHMATELLGNTYVARIRHSHMQKLELMIQEFAHRHERIWYIADALYSMRGDYAPFRELSVLLDRYQKLHVYLDDAHSTSWYGERGRGAALSHLPNIERVVVALSLNKSLSAAGGAVALSTPELKKRVYACGGTMLFSGPIQPPMLGAAVALGETTSFTRASYSSGRS